MSDLIDRQATAKRLLNERKHYDCHPNIGIGLDIARMIIEDYCPAVQQDTPTDTQTATYALGKWIKKEDDGYHGGGYTECSVCGQRYSWGGYFEANEFRYCPRCGHRMEVEEDE